jgi:hypothetical protein
LLVLFGELGHQFARGQHRVDGADALAAAPDVAPGLGVLVAARTEVHGRRIADRQVGRVEPRLDDRRPQVVAVHAGEEVGIEDVVGVALDDHVLVALYGVGLLPSR